MALWGLTDDLAGAPKWLTPSATFTGGAAANAVETAKLVIGDHPFETGDGVKYTKGGSTVVTNLVDGTTYFVRRIATKSGEIELYGTKEQAEDTGATTGRLAITADSGSIATHTLQKVPSDVYFVDAVEAADAGNRKKGFQTPGWYKYVTKNAGEFGTNTTVLSTLTSKTDAGVFNCAAQSIRIGDKIVITGTDSASAFTSGYTGGDDFIVTAISAGTEGIDVTEFTIQEDGSAVSTAGGDGATTGLTFTLHPSIARDQAQLLCAIGDPVSLGTYAGDDGVDGDDDSVVAGGAEGIIFTSQTTNMTESMANAAAATFSVVANSSTATGLAIKFFRSTEEFGTYTELTDDGATNQVIVTAMSGGPGAATSQLTLTSNVGTGGATAGADATTAGAVVYYKATVEATGAATLTSDIVKLSVVGT